MKTKISRISRRTVSIVLALMLLFSALITANAADVKKNATGDAKYNGGQIYFDASCWSSTYSYVYLVIWNTSCSWNVLHRMTNISGTKLYYITVPNEGTNGGIMIVGTNTSQTTGSWSNRTNYDSFVGLNWVTKYTGTTNWDYTYNANSNYYATAANSNNGADLSCSYNSSGTINNVAAYKKTQYARVYKRSGGSGSYTNVNASSTAYGTLKLSGKQWNNGTSLKSTATEATANANTSISNIAYSSTVSVTTAPATGYTLAAVRKGTSEPTTTTAGSAVSMSSNSGSYTVDNAYYVSAFFDETMNTVTFTKKLGTNAATTMDTASAGVTTAASYTAPDESGYNFTGWEITLGSDNASNVTGTESASDTTVSLNASGAVTVQANYEEAGTCAITAKNTNSSGAVLSTEAMTIGSNMTVYAEGNAYHSSGNFSVSSSDPTVASVSSATVAKNGTFTVAAKKAGEATITISCTADSKSTTFDVEVSKSDLAATFSSADHVYVLKGDNTQTMGYTATPTVSSVSYSSGNTSVATVDSSTGAVTPVSAGTATMTVSVTYANGGTDTATKDIKVQDPTLTVSSNTLALDYTSNSTNAGSDYKGTNTFDVTTNGNNPAYNPVTEITVESSDTSVVTVSPATITSTSAQTVTATAKKVGTANIIVRYKINGTEVTSLRKTISVTVSAYDVNMTIYATGSTTYWNSNCYFIPSTGSGGTAMVKIGTANSKPVYALNITKKQFTDGFYFGTAAATSTSSNHNTVKITGSDTTKNFYTITDVDAWYSSTVAKSSVTITKPIISAKSNETLNAGATKVATAPTISNGVTPSSYKWTTANATYANFTANITTATPTITGVAAGSATGSTVRAFIPLANTGITFTSLETSSTAAYDYIASNAQSFNITVNDVKHTITVVAVSRDTSSGSYTTNASAMSASSVSPTGGISHGGSATVSATAEAGYVLTGYYSAATGTATQYTNGAIASVTSDMTVYARFEQKYTLTFTSAHGTVSGTGYSSNSLTTYAGAKPSNLTVAVAAGYKIDWANSTNLSKYYNSPSSLTGSVSLTAKEAANINSADKINTAVTIAYTAITPQINFSASKTDNGTDYSSGGGEVTAKKYTGTPGGGGGGGTATSYKVLYGANNSLGSTSSVTVYLKDGSYVANLSSDSTFLSAFNANPGNFYIAMSSNSSTSNIVSVTNASSITLSGGLASNYGKDAQEYTFSGTKRFARIYRSSGTPTIGGVKFTLSGSSYAFELSSSAISDGSGSVVEGDSVTSGSTVSYNDQVMFSANPSSGYVFEGWYTNAGVEVSTDNPYYSGARTEDSYTIVARFQKQYYVSLYNTYEEEGDVGNKTYKYVSSPPNRVEIEREGSTITYTYKAGTLGDHTQRGYEHVVSDSGGNYYEGNKIPINAGDTIKLCYVALASSDTITSVLFNNTLTDGTTERHYTVEGETNNPTHDDWDYTYTSDTCLWADANYYPEDASTIGAQTYAATVDNNSHTVEWTVSGNYLNLDIELATKRQITFKDETGLTITSKNVDNYYSANEDLSTGSTTGLKALAATSDTCTYTVGTPTYTRKDTGADVTSTLTSSPYNFAYNTTTGKFTGKMPNYDVVIDMHVTTSYTAKIGSWMLADPINGSTAGFNKWNKVASVTGAISSGGSQSDTVYDVADGSRATVDQKTITSGTTITYSTSLYNDYKNDYLFVGWYRGTSSAPDMENGLISKDKNYTYTPKRNVHVWAVGTRMMYIGGSFYIKDGVQTYIADGDTKATWKSHLQMTWDAKGNRYAYTFENISTNTAYHFRVYEKETNSTNGEENATIWNRWASSNNKKYDYDFDGSTHTLDYGRYYTSGNDYNDGGWDNCGWFNVDTDVLNGGYDKPVTVYFYPDTGGIEVSATYKWKKVYVSSGLNGFENGTKITTNNTSAAPNKTATVAAATGTTIATGSKSWNPDGTYANELHVQEYYVKTKDGTITVTKDVSSGYKVAAFVVYEYDNHDVYSVEASKIGETNSYKADIQIFENCYIYPVLESTSADMTVYVNSVDIDTTKWGDLVSLYAWNTSDAAMNGAFPGQLMIPSAKGDTWYANISSTNLRGITFSNNFKDMWLENQVHYSTVISTYNTIENHNNVTAQTYDYREPKPLTDIAKNSISAGREDKVILSFSLKDGNIDLTSYNGTVASGTYEGAGTVSSSFYTAYYEKKQTIDPSQFHYLTNRDHSQYTDLNGTELGEDYKPTASFYVICKGNTQYLNGVNQSKTAINYSSIDTYSGKWSVDWFVYDAAGNYITSILSAGYADREGNLSTNLSRVAEAVHDAGYAYEDKAVGISYDFPQSYNSNSLYRFSGQWISTSSTTPVTLNVKVGMKLGEDEDGPIMDISSTNSETYGTATASYTGRNSAIATGSSNEYVKIKLSDAANKPVQVTATNDNDTFIGWYTYNEKTEQYEEISGSDLTFNPTFDMDTTIYAIYEAKATYRFKYTGREPDGSGSYDKYYVVQASNLTPTEVGDENRPNTATVLDSGETRLQEAQRLAPGNADIAVFKKTATVNKTTCTASAYTLTFDCTTTNDSYTLTYYYYKGANGTSWGSATASGGYNTPVDLSAAIKNAVLGNAPSGKHFVGWYDAQIGGNLISHQNNFGMAIIGAKTVYAHYETTDPVNAYSSTPVCEENILSREMTAADKGTYYNDFLCQFRKSDGTSQTASNCGVLVIYQDDINSETFGASSLTDANKTTALNALRANPGMVGKSTAKNLKMFNISATELSIFSRVDLVFKSGYSDFVGRKYTAIPYVYDGSSYTFGTAVTESTYS